MFTLQNAIYLITFRLLKEYEAQVMNYKKEFEINKVSFNECTRMIARIMKGIMDGETSVVPMN